MWLLNTYSTSRLEFHTERTQRNLTEQCSFSLTHLLIYEQHEQREMNIKERRIIF